MRLPIVLFMSFFLSSLAEAQLASSADTAQPLSVGARAPDFEARRSSHARYVFSSQRLRHPTIVIFYRGGWCPYCNAQLADLHEVEPKLKKSGFDVLFVSTDRPALLYSSLKHETLAKALSYTLLSDPELHAAQAFGVAYHLSDEMYAQQLKWGVDLERTTGTKLHALPVPSVFLIDRSGVIRFVYSNPDYRVRLSAEDLWNAAAALSAGR